MIVAIAMERYLSDIIPAERSNSQVADRQRSEILIEHLGNTLFLPASRWLLPDFEILVWQERIEQMTTEISDHEKQSRPSRSCSAWTHTDDSG
jgi:hypothetical protein